MEYEVGKVHALKCQENLDVNEGKCCDISDINRHKIPSDGTGAWGLRKLTYVISYDPLNERVIRISRSFDRSMMKSFSAISYLIQSFQFFSVFLNYVETHKHPET